MFFCNFRLFVGLRENGNCNPVDREGATSGIIVVGLLVDCKGEAGVSCGETQLEDFLEVLEMRERKVTIGLVGMSKPERVKGWKSTGLEKTERQSSQGGTIDDTTA